jgi:hypothetical protein
MTKSELAPKLNRTRSLPKIALALSLPYNGFLLATSGKE